MQPIYWVLFATFCVPAAVLEYTENGCFGLAEGRRGGPARSRDYLRFRANYVTIFSLMMAGDWLQGPYVYHLYEHYGFSVRDIGRLFIMGFGSSAVFGTLAGAMADRRGRKRAALLYVVTYALSCLTKHSPNYWILLVGRLLGGIATSLLFSAFESWAVAEHSNAGFDPALLGDLFTKAVFLGNGLMAIASGLLGNVLVEGLGLGPVAPFDAAVLVLLAGGAAIHATWEENYGDRGGSGRSLAAQFRQALQTIQRDQRVALLGASQALFEASMYTFVFLWTPALSPAGEKLPHGFIFATFMTASMVGTALAGRLLGRLRLETVMQAVFWCSAVSLAVPVLFHLQRSNIATMEDMLLYGEDNELQPISLHISPRLLQAVPVSPPLPQEQSASPANSSNYDATPALDVSGASASDALASASDAGRQIGVAGGIQLVAFCVFEVLIGMFWPSMMTLRARYVPEQQRSTIINVFRIPLNVFVCIILWKVSDFPLGVVFTLCSIFLCLAAICQQRLAMLADTLGSTPPCDSKGDADLDHESSSELREIPKDCNGNGNGLH